MKKFKKAIALVLTIVTVMACGAVGVSAAEAGSALEAGKYKVTANLYVAKSDNFIKLIDAYLGDESVPPTQKQTLNATMTVAEDGTKSVEIDLKNDVFNVIYLDKNNTANTEVKASDGNATLKVTGTTEGSYGSWTEKITQVTATDFEFGEYYRFENAQEYASRHAVTVIAGAVGPKEMPLTLLIEEEGMTKID